MYSINSKPLAMQTMKSAGGEFIEVAGYNFAPSKFLACSFGVSADAYSHTPAAYVGSSMTCPYLATIPSAAPVATSQGGRRNLLQHVVSCESGSGGGIRGVSNVVREIPTLRLPP